MISRIFRGLSAAACALALASCASSSPPAPEAQLGSPSGAAPLESRAMAFESFMRHGREIDPGFSRPSEVSAALQAGAGHDPTQLEAGMVAYAALAALQEPAFVASVRRAAIRGDLARRLASDPSAALTLPGGEAAAARAGAALLRQGQALSDNGQRVKRASYSIQRQAWSRTRVGDPRGRLAQVKRTSQSGYRAQPGDAAWLRQAIAGGGRAGGQSPVVARGVALAALSVLGQEASGRALMSEPRSESCLRLAKLNLYQCLASAGPHYEDVYCLGQHALIDPGQCVAEAVHDGRAPRPGVTRASWRP